MTINTRSLRQVVQSSASKITGHTQISACVTFWNYTILWCIRGRTKGTKKYSFNYVWTLEQMTGFGANGSFGLVCRELQDQDHINDRLS